jgi:hypothetical protein
VRTRLRGRMLGPPRSAGLRRHPRGEWRVAGARSLPLRGAPVHAGREHHGGHSYRELRRPCPIFLTAIGALTASFGRLISPRSPGRPVHLYQLRSPEASRWARGRAAQAPRTGRSGPISATAGAASATSCLRGGVGRLAAAVAVDEGVFKMGPPPLVGPLWNLESHEIPFSQGRLPIMPAPRRFDSETRAPCGGSDVRGPAARPSGEIRARRPPACRRAAGHQPGDAAELGRAA